MHSVAGLLSPPQQANHLTTLRVNWNPTMPAILQPLGAILALLAIWLMWCDRDNDFIGPLFVVALALLCFGLVMP